MKNYMTYLDYQLKLYGMVVLVSVLSYGVSSYFGFRQPFVLTPGHVVTWVSMSLSFIFIGAYMMAKQNPFNK